MQSKWAAALKKRGSPVCYIIECADGAGL